MQEKKKVLPYFLQKFEEKIGTDNYSNEELAEFLERSLEAYEIFIQVENDEEELITLASHPNGFIRRHIALSEKVPVEILEMLSEDASITVRECVAKNPNTPLDILKKLSENDITRASVALNESIPFSYLEELSKDSNSEVRYSVASNVKTPCSILFVLAHDENYLVRNIAAVKLRKKLDS